MANGSKQDLNRSAQDQEVQSSSECTCICCFYLPNDCTLYPTLLLSQ